MTGNSWHKNDDNISRREFINRSIKAGLSITLAGSVSYALYDSEGPSGIAAESTLTVPDFSVPHIKNKTMAVIKGNSREKSVTKGIELLGGITRFVKPGGTVLIKPNIAFASSPALGATTNPQLLAEVIRLCYKGGGKKVIVTDNPINDPAGCFLLSGIEEACKDAGAKIIYPEKKFFKPATLPEGKLIRNWPILYDHLAKADTLIGIAPLKSHHRSGASMTMKNWYGLLGGRRNIFHQDIHTIISELAALIKPSLVILDAFDVMKTNGPTGGSLSDLEKKNTMILSCDQVAADSYGSTLLGMKPDDLPYLQKADKTGAGTTNYKKLNPIFDLEGSL